MGFLSDQPIAQYYPLEKGIYEVGPGLRTLGTDLGNGSADSKIFQFDLEFEKYRNNKLECRGLDFQRKHFLTHDWSIGAERAFSRFMINKLCEESPEYFQK